MKKIQKQSFVQAFQKAKKAKHLSTAQVAKDSELSRSYVYHIISPHYKLNITIPTVKKVGKGLRMNTSEIHQWINTMIKVPAPHRQRAAFTPQQNQLIPRIKALMAQEKLSVDDLAKRSGLNRYRVSNYLKGRVKFIPNLTIVRLAGGLKTDAKKLLAVANRRPDKSRHVSSNFTPAKPIKRSPASSLNRNSIKQVMSDINQLNDADVAIVDLIVNRLIAAECHQDQK